MFDEYSRHDFQPMTYWGRIPVYVTSLVVMGCIAGLVFGTVEFVSHWSVLGASMTMDPEKIWKGAQLWRVVTYPFLSYPLGLWPFLAIFFLAYFGVQVEQYLGRRRIGLIYALSVLVPVFVYTLFWFFMPVGGSVGPNYLYISVIVSFATLYPNAIIWFIPMKWLAAIFVFLGLIFPLAARNFAEFFAFSGVCGAVFGYIRWMQLGAEMPNFRSLFRRKPKFRVVRPEETEDESTLGSVDQILEKISKHGIGSLTAKEKAALEKGRSELLKREKGK